MQAPVYYVMRRTLACRNEVSRWSSAIHKEAVYVMFLTTGVFVLIE